MDGFMNGAMSFLLLWAALYWGITAYEYGVRLFWAVPFVIFLLFAKNSNIYWL